jgi:hypothetical protein
MISRVSCVAILNADDLDRLTKRYLKAAQAFGALEFDDEAR